AVNDVIVDPVLDVRRFIPDPVEPLRVGFIFGEEQFRLVVADEVTQPGFEMARADQAEAGNFEVRVAAHPRPALISAPRPGVAEPRGRPHVNLCRLRAAIDEGDTNQDVFDCGLGVFDEQVEIAVVVEHARVNQLILRLRAAAVAAFVDDLRVREFGLWVFVGALHVGMRRGRVEVEVILLAVLAVIALAAGQAEEAFFQDRVAPVPEGEREAEDLPAVGNPGDAVLAPAVSLRARVVVRQVIPRRPARAVILAHGSPLPFGQVRPPAFPVCFAVAGLLKSLLFSGHDGAFLLNERWDCWLVGTSSNRSRQWSMPESSAPRLYAPRLEMWSNWVFQVTGKKTVNGKFK